MTYSTEVSHTQTVSTNRDFTVTFPFIATTDLRVQLNGVTKALDTDYTIVQSGANTVINFNTAPANGNTIRIFRDTNIDAISATFAAGSSIRSTDLNSNNTQLLYAAQEFGTLKSDNSVSFSLGDKGDIQINSSSDWQIQNNVIENANMADNSVGNNELIDGSITGSKFASLSITSALLATNSVITNKILNAAVTTDKIANDSITNSKIDDETIEPTKLKPTTVAGPGFTPAGTVIWFAGQSAPTGYLKANGDSIPNGSGTVQGISADFSGLYAIVGGNLPDLRGEFIRGFDDGRAVDDSRSIRSTQSQEMLTHTHTASSGSEGGHIHSITGGSHHHMMNTSTNNQSQQHLVNRRSNSFSSSGNVKLMSYKFGAGTGPGEAWQTDSADISLTVGTSGAHTHNVSISNYSGGTEVRPRNVALLACIKY